MAVSSLMSGFSQIRIFSNLMIGTTILFLFSITIIATPYTLVLVWVSNVEEIFSKPDKDLIPWAIECIRYFNLIDENLSVFFLYYFTLDQFFWICNIFLTISLLVGTSHFHYHIILHCSGTSI